MAKMKDITEKLSFDGNPALLINGTAVEVNADAPTMLKTMGLLADGTPGPKEMMDAFDLIFPEKSKKEIRKLNLNFKDTLVVIQEAISLITGEEDDGPGEQ